MNVLKLECVCFSVGVMHTQPSSAPAQKRQRLPRTLLMAACTPCGCGLEPWKSFSYTMDVVLIYSGSRFHIPWTSFSYTLEVVFIYHGRRSHILRKSFSYTLEVVLIYPSRSHISVVHIRRHSKMAP